MCPDIEEVESLQFGVNFAHQVAAQESVSRSVGSDDDQALVTYLIPIPNHPKVSDSDEVTVLKACSHLKSPDQELQSTAGQSPWTNPGKL